MIQFLVEYSQTGTAQLREQFRAEHIEFRKGLGTALLLAGPLLDAGGASIGSLVIVEADGVEAAQRLALADPYVRKGVLQVESVRAMKVAFIRSDATKSASV